MKFCMVIHSQMFMRKAFKSLLHFLHSGFRIQQFSISWFLFRAQPNRRNPTHFIPPPPPIETLQHQNVPQPPSHQQIPRNQAHTANLQITIETSLQILTESITEDLNRLQSLQVVSNMLRTDFRDTLENMVQVIHISFSMLLVT